MKLSKILFFLCFISVKILAQNTVNVTVNLVPPYSTRLSDYANQPGKVLITLRNTIARAQSVYLRINITGDNGIQVFTNPNFRASRAVTLQPNAIVTLTISDLQTLFDVNSLSTRGTTINQIERQNGLPEGTYSVCVRAFDFTRQNFPLSQDSPLGCTTIRLTQLEPPILIKPFADEEVTTITPQNQIFLWTPPAGSPAGTQYQLKIVEMFDPKRNPNDAFLARTNPSFFEKIVNGTTYVYGPADPPLVEGRKYAWAVTALDKVNAGGGRVTSEGSSFRNGGRSEIRSFVYGKNRNTSGLNIPDFAGTKKKESKPKNQFQIDPELNLNKLMTTVSGKLFFNFPEDLSLKPDGTIDESKYPNFVQQGNSNAYKIRAINHIKPNLLSKPLANVKITLLKVYAINGVEAKEISSKDNYFGMNQITKNWSIMSRLDFINGTGEFKNANDYKFGSESLNNQDFMVPIASGSTDANGNFSLAFMLSDTLKSGVLSIKNPGFTSSHTIEKTLILVVENPYYNSPFVMISPLPGEVIQLPEMVSTVRSFGLEIATKNDTKAGQMGGGGGSLENINIEFLRLKQPNANLPSEEGQNLPPSTKSSLKIPDSHKYLLSNNTIERVISLGKTDNSGKIQVNRIVRLGNESERFVAHAFSDKNIGVYSKIDVFKVFDVNKDANFKTDLQGVVLGKDLGIDNLSFNLTYQLRNYKTDLILPSAPAVIKGKVVENNLPLKDVVVVLKKRTMALGTGIAKALAYDDTDQDGYFEFKNVEPGDYIIEFVKDGYKLGVFDGSVSSKNETFQATTYNVKNYFTVLFGQLLQTNEIKMVPNGILAGCVRDEDGNKVIADIKVGNSTIFKNIEKADVEKVEGCFLFSAPSGTQKITLLPRSLEYFSEELTYTINETGITKIPNEKLVVYRKKHRMIFVVMPKVISDVAIPISNAKITVNGKDYITDNKGQVLVEFESPGTQFLVKVKPDLKDNYAVWEKEIAIPVVKKPVPFEIFLDKGKELLATVTELDNGVAKPSKGAKVYIKSLGKNWGNNTTNFTECYTDEKGNCTLRGIPQSENNLKVWVMKDEQTVKTANLIELQKSGAQVSPNTGNLQNTVLNPNNPSGNSSSSSAAGSYLGEEKTASWTGSQTKATVNLQLKFDKGLNIKNIWGWPVKIEKTQPSDNGSILASGYFYNLPDNPTFKTADKNLRLDFVNLKMVKAAAGSNSHEPAVTEIKLSQSTFAVVIGTQLQGKATPNSSLLNPILQQEFPAIKIKKTGDKAELVGAVELRLSSFEGAYQFSGKFNLAENNNPSGVVIFRTGETGQRKLQIGTATSADKLEPAKYKVHGFDASSDLSKSYILGDSVKIFTVLHTKIPEIQPSDISLQAGFITVLPETILPFAGGNEISFNLEKWKVSGQKSNFYTPTWIFDKINGGLRIPKVLVNTGLVAVSLKNLIIKPDKLIIDSQNFDQQDAKNFTLGGLIPLEIAKGATASFTFDPNAYHDNKPHWKFTLAAPAGVKTAASVSNLDGLEKGQKLEFGTMNLFSDNQQQLNSPSSSLLRFFDILDFKLNTIDIGPNAFTMVGNASLAIPNMKSQNPGSEGVLGQIVYGKNASGQIKASIKPMFFSVEGKGQVRFDASDMVNSQTLTQGKFTSKGKLRIYDTQSGKDFFVDALLSHSKSGNAYTTNITVEPNQKIPLESKYLAIKTGLEYSSMSVVSNEWQNLKLTTILPNSGSGGFNQLLNDEKNRTITFIVKGAIETDPSSGAVGIKGMNTGMGQLSLYYNFQRQEVRGQFLFTPPAPVPLGLFNLNSANVSMAIGGNGMYMMTNGVGDVAIAGLPLPLTVGYSFIGGYYTKPIYPEDQAIFLGLAVKKSLPEVFQNEVKGMLVSGSVSIEPFNDTYSYFDETLQTGAKGKVFVGIAGESRNYFKYNEGTNATIFCGNYSYGGVTIEGSAEILGIGAYAGAHANIQIATEGSINTPDITKGFKAIKESMASLKLEGCGSITMGVFLGVETPLGSAGFNVSKTISARAGYKNEEPYIDFSLNDCGNAMPSDKIKHTVEKTQ
ncbi:MAG: hypothetical protein MUF45_02200 [Spirosomaceae bacterium]|nr:hypothetical protein [Spirosomataceae bacterium]